MRYSLPAADVMMRSSLLARVKALRSPVVFAAAVAGAAADVVFSAAACRGWARARSGRLQQARVASRDHGREAVVKAAAGERAGMKRGEGAEAVFMIGYQVWLRVRLNSRPGP